LVGRDAEVRALETLLDGLDVGRGSVLVVTGEAGVGKTRLAEDVATRAAARGFRTVWSGALEGAGAPPLWLWSRVLEQLVGSADLLAQRVVEGTTPGDAESARFDQFEGVARAVRVQAAEGPLVIILDDVQWADTASLQLLSFVTTSVRTIPCLLLVTGRPAELAPEDLATLSRLGSTIALGGLAPEAVREILNTIVGADVGSDAVEVVAARSGGNPLFVSELGRLMRSTGRSDVAAAAIPAGIAALVERRLARLREPVVACLQAGAVLGRECAVAEVDRVLAVTTLEPEAASVAFAEAEAAALVLSTAPGRVVFSHDLVRDAVVAATPAVLRAALHRAAAEVCLARASDPWAVATAAAHLEAAGASAAAGAGPLWEQAGEAALMVLAYEQAAAWFGRAGESASGARRVDLLLAEADAWLRAGRLEAARARFADAAAAARAASMPDRFASAVLGIGAGTAAWEVPLWDAEHVGLIEEAIATVPADDLATRATLLARLSVARATPQTLESSRALAEEAIDLARRAGSPRVEAQALAALCDALAAPQHASVRRAHGERIGALAEVTGDRVLALLGQRFLVVACLELGDFPAFDAAVARFVPAVQQLRQPLLEWYGPLFLGMRALLRGDLDAAERYRREVVAAADRTGSSNAALLGATLGLGVACASGRPIAPDLFDGIVEADPAVWASYAASLAFVAAEDGDRGRAAAMLHLHAADEFARIGDDAEHLVTLTMFGRVAVWLGDLDAAARIHSLLSTHSGLWIVDGIAAYCWGPVDLELARLDAALGRVDAAADHLAAARRGLVAAGATLLLAECDELADRLGGNRPPDAETGTEDPAEWRRNGALWTIRYGGHTAHIKHAKGVADIARLLAHPGGEIAAADLFDPGDETGLRVAGDLGEVLDAAARAAYRDRLRELEDEVDDAEAMHDVARAERARAERDFLTAELAAAVGLGGRARVAGDPNERSRKAVTNRIRLAIDRVTATHPALGRHLDHAIRTGTFCSYRPEHPVAWRVDGAT
jgi:hypothetical protein